MAHLCIVASIALMAPSVRHQHDGAHAARGIYGALHMRSCPSHICVCALPRALAKISAALASRTERGIAWRGGGIIGT